MNPSPSVRPPRASLAAMCCAALLLSSTVLAQSGHRAGALSDKPPLRDARTLTARDFVVADGEDLKRDGRVVRYWGAQGNLIAATHADLDHEVSILAKQGYNLHRFASHQMRPWVGGPGKDAYVPGDNSPTDRFFYLSAACARQGIDLWGVALGVPHWRTLADVKLIDDHATADAWTEAVAHMLDSGKKGSKDFRMAAVFDPRLKAAWQKHIRGVLNTVNPYTGLRLADDPAYVTWEISNEQWSVARMLWGNHLELPRFIQDEIQQSWTAWLSKRYRTQSEMENAWGGLLPGESLADGKVLMLPLDNRRPISADIVTYGVGVKLTPGQANGENLSEARARDVRAFVVDRVRALKADLIATARGEGKSGIGIAVVPIVADTEFNGTTISLWQNMVGSGTTPSLYHDLSGGDPGDPKFPWYSGLFGTPVFNDWFDDKRVRGKPTLMYEAMIWQPAKYRAEYAWRVAAQAAVQNFGVVDFHYYGHPLPAGSTDLTALGSQRMTTVSTTRLPDGLIYRMDPVLTAAFHAAGTVFRLGYLAPAPEPVTLVLGRRSLESLDNVKGNDPAIRATAYRKGFRYDFDPSTELDRLEGELVDPARAPAVFSPTRGLTYDTTNGRMIVDVPQAKAVVGFQADRHAFDDGVTIRDIRVVSPPNMPFVIEGERYAALSLVSLDGKGLDRSREVLVTAVNTAWNSGTEFDAAKRGPKLNDAPALAAALAKRGGAPVLEGRVGCTFVAPWLKGRTAVFTDRFGRELKRETLGGDQLVWSADEPIYEVHLLQ